MSKRTSQAWTAIFAGFVALASSAQAQVAEDTSYAVDLLIDSGWVENLGAGNQPAVVYSTLIDVGAAPWTRLHFGENTLSGDPAGGGAYLIITSLQDGDWQRLTSEGLEHWGNSSAFFNGGTLLLELYAFPNEGPCRIAIDTATVGGLPVVPRSLCGADDRVLSYDARCARTSTGCSSWMIHDFNRQFLTAGHCTATGSTLVYFNVPLSNGDGSTNVPPVEDQYPVEGTSVQGVNGGVGNDYRYFGVNPNSNTGLQPYQVQGDAFTLAPAPSNSPPGQPIRITGYGTTTSPIPPQWNAVQKTAVGPMVNWSGTSLSYQTDTTGGNSGSPVIQENTGLAIGIHTHGGCSGSGGNFGTAIQNTGLQGFLNAPKGVCRSGMGTVLPPLFAVSDLANNFGTLNRVNGEFAKVSQAPGRMTGMTFNPWAQVFYAVDGFGNFYAADAASGNFTLLGQIVGLSGTPTALAYDSSERVVYAMVQAGGVLYRFTAAQLQATQVGAGTGGAVGGLEFDAATGTLYGLDDNGGTKLFTFNTTTGAKTLVGSLGAAITDCNGLGWVAADSQLYTINATTETLMHVNKATGVATVIGNTNGVFGSTYGIAAEAPAPACPGDFDGNGSVGQGDLATLLAAYETCHGQPGWSAVADMNGDGCVTQADLAALLAAYGDACP